MLRGIESDKRFVFREMGEFFRVFVVKQKLEPHLILFQPVPEIFAYARSYVAVHNHVVEVKADDFFHENKYCCCR